MDTWKSEYSDDLSVGARTLRRLFERGSDDATYAALKLILDKAPRFLQEYYALVPDYRDGLEFVSFAYEVIMPRKGKIPPERFMRWEICLITLRLEMLDKLGRWREYRDYFDEMYKRHPGYQGHYSKTAKHLKISRAHPYLLHDDGEFYHVHFLYLLLPRYEAINKYLKVNKKTPVTRKQPVIDAQTTLRNYKLLAERLDMLLSLDEKILSNYR